MRPARLVVYEPRRDFDDPALWTVFVALRRRDGATLKSVLCKVTVRAELGGPVLLGLDGAEGRDAEIVGKAAQLAVVDLEAA